MRARKCPSHGQAVFSSRSTSASAMVPSSSVVAISAPRWFQMPVRIHLSTGFMYVLVTKSRLSETR